MITKAQQKALQGALKFDSTGDVVEWMNARYRRLAAGGDGRFRGHDADFVRRLSPADDFMINLPLAGSEDPIALLAARDYAVGGDDGLLRGGLVAFNRLKVLILSASPPFERRVIGADAIAALAAADQESFEAHVGNMTRFLPLEFGQPLVAVLHNLMVSVVHGIERELAIRQAEQFIAKGEVEFDAVLVSLLKSILLPDLPLLVHGFDRLMSLQRRSNWVAARMPANRFIPIFLIGLYFLCKRCLAKPQFHMVNLQSQFRDWLPYIRYLESADGQAIKPFINFAGETSFLNLMIADPVSASTNLRSRLHAAWVSRSTTPYPPTKVPRWSR